MVLFVLAGSHVDGNELEIEILLDEASNHALGWDGEYGAVDLNCGHGCVICASLKLYVRERERDG